MRLNLFRQPEAAKERIDIYYAEMTPRLRQIIAVIEDASPRIEGRLEDERVLLPLESVYYVDTVDRRTYLYLEKEVYRADMTLGDFQQAFGDFGFARVNKSQIVNLLRIRRVRPTAGMRIVATLENGEQLIINRSYRDSVEEVLRSLGRSRNEKVGP